MKKNNLFFYPITIIGMFFWGMSFIWVKIMLNYYGPFTVITLRMAISVILMILIDKAFFKKSEKIDRKDYKYFALLAFFEPFLYFVFEGYGINLVSSTIASVIIGTIPVFSPLFAYLFYKEKLTVFGLIGLIVSFAGVCIMVLDSKFAFIYSKAGIGLMFGAVFSTVFYVLVVKKIGIRYKPLTVIRYQNTIGLFYFLPFFGIIEFKQFVSVQLNSELVITLLLLAIFPSTLSFITYNISLNKIGIGRTNLFTNLIPVFSGIFSYIILKEHFDLKKIIAMVIIIAGVTLAQVTPQKEKIIIEY